MIIPGKSLPSNGLYTKNIEINPINYIKLKTYQVYSVKSVCDELIRDIEIFLTSIQDWRNLLLYDLESLIFSVKYISVTPNNNLIHDFSDDCGYSGQVTINLENVKFDTLSKTLLDIKSVNINSHEFRIDLTTKIGTFYNFLKSIEKWSLPFTRDDYLLFGFLANDTNQNEVYSAMINAMREDISLISYLEETLIGRCSYEVTCPNCKKGVVVGLSDLITNMFRCIKLNSIIDDKITLAS